MLHFAKKILCYDIFILQAQVKRKIKFKQFLTTLRKKKHIIPRLKINCICNYVERKNFN